MICLDDARAHLRIDGYEDDAEIRLKIDIVDALMASYIGHLRGDNPDQELSPELLDAEARRFRHESALDAARLLVLGELWTNRESSTSDPLSPTVKNLLQIFREPGYA